jgi:hypothetical protein
MRHSMFERDPANSTTARGEMSRMASAMAMAG